FLRGWLLPDHSLASAARLWVVPSAAAATVLFAHQDGRLVGLAALVTLACAALGYAPLPVSLRRRPYRVFAWCLACAGLLLSTGVLLRDLEDGRAWIFVAILGTFATDTGAYATGRAVGRRRLAPTISPSKTVEGAIGGLIAGAAAVVVLGSTLPGPAPAAVLLALPLLLPVGGQAGDLVESWMKRRMGIKDSSGLLPGHGGILDRLDSILVTVPATYLVVRFLGS
ncbi:MAG: phosphatidate cytidylyltransferase, partial [Dehalococcoidia bacterium]